MSKTPFVTTLPPPYSTRIRRPPGGLDSRTRFRNCTGAEQDLGWAVKLEGMQGKYTSFRSKIDFLSHYMFTVYSGVEEKSKGADVNVP